MWEFIVLGQVPGINIQINFWTWLAIVPPTLLLTTLIWRIRKQKTLSFLLIVASLYMQRGSIRRRQLA